LTRQRAGLILPRLFKDGQPPVGDYDDRPALDAAIDTVFLLSSLLDPLRLRIWDAEGLTVTQLRLLNWVAEEGGLSNADLADRLYVTRPSVSALLDRLERGGFIRREIAPNDRRGIRIWLEERGLRAVSQTRQETREFARRLWHSLSDKDLETVTRALILLVAAGQGQRAADLKAEHEAI
jgi:DNA-binding MarR family transcriptional regulator